MKLMLIGRGRLGTSLAHAAESAGHHATLFPGRAWPDELAEELRRPERTLVMLAAPDQFLADLAARLAAVGPAAASAFVHVSGAADLTVLEPLAARGNDVGSFHPLQSFPRPRPPSAFMGSLFAIEYSSEALGAELRQLARDLGGVPHRIQGPQHTRYHAAAVMASNYVIALAGQATGLLVETGLSRDQALEAILPLMRGVLGNLEELGLPDALIGPIRRGDHETVSRQLAALASEPVAFDVYRSLGLAALELAAEAGLPPAQQSRIRDVLGTGLELPTR
jgi:predicted short-subunit dehydrogenase-like oxidoreductase (DUF2520 family)